MQVENSCQQKNMKIHNPVYHRVELSVMALAFIWIFLAKILISAISSAQSSIYIVTPYFLPPRELIVAIQSAALRGVAVTLLLPANNNLPYVHWAMRNSLWQFLQYGVRNLLSRATI